MLQLHDVAVAQKPDQLPARQSKVEKAENKRIPENTEEEE